MHNILGVINWPKQDGVDAALSFAFEAVLKKEKEKKKQALRKLTHTFPAHNPAEEKSVQWRR